MEKATNFRIVFVTNNSYDNSYQLAKVLINEKLAACCTIIPNNLSIFGWKDEVIERHEFTLLIKTSELLLNELESRIKEIHTDEVPEIVAVEMNSASESYLAWMKETLKDS